MEIAINWVETTIRFERISVSLLVAGALAVGGLCAKAKATLVNSNSIIQDGIEYYMQTDTAVYNLEENVEMLYRITNLGSGDVRFEFPSTAQYFFYVEQNGTVVWGGPRQGQMVVTEFTLSQNESIEFDDIWHVIVFNESKTGYIPAEVRTYDVIGQLQLNPANPRYVPVSASVEIIPEPSTLALMALGAGMLARRNRGKRKS